LPAKETSAAKIRAGQANKPGPTNKADPRLQTLKSRQLLTLQTLPKQRTVMLNHAAS